MAAPNLPLHLPTSIKTWYPTKDLPENLPPVEGLKVACAKEGIAPIAYSYSLSTDSYLVYSEPKA